MRAIHLRLRRLAGILFRLRRERGGDVAIIFALALIPLLAFIGVAIDYSRANAVRADLQAALDSTALMVSKNAAALSPDILQSTAKSYFLALFNNKQASNIQFTASYSTTGGSNLAVSGSADMATDFMGIFGFDKITVTGNATSKWGSARLRVALVLDTTGSMNDDGKIGALKTATNSLLTQWKAAVSVDGDVYVSIIPFSKDVNVDGTNSSATWIDWSDWDAPPSGLATSYTDSNGPGDSCPYSSSGNGYTCTTAPTNGSSNTSNIPSSGTYKGYICPSVDNGRITATRNGHYYNGCYNSTTYSCTGSACTCTGHSHCSCSGSGSRKSCTTNSGYYEHAWIKNAHSTWNGCVTDRGSSTAPGTSSGNDQKTTAPSTGDATTLFMADQYSLCAPKMMGLSYNWSSMTTVVNGLTPNGSTNQPIGLVWGWQSLVGGGPLTAPAQDSGYTYQQVIILLSDGLNTQDRWYGDGTTTNTSVDGRMYNTAGTGTCSNIKAAGITIYTVQVNTGGDPTSTLLQNCASTSDKFFLLTSANQIITTFQKIGTALSQLRIAQ